MTTDLRTQPTRPQALAQQLHRLSMTMHALYVRRLIDAGQIESPGEPQPACPADEWGRLRGLFLRDIAIALRSAAGVGRTLALGSERASELEQDVRVTLSEILDQWLSQLDAGHVDEPTSQLFSRLHGRLGDCLRRLGHAPTATADVLLEDDETQAGKTPHKAVLNETERNIVAALGGNTMTGEEIASRAGCPYNSNFKSTLSGLRKRGVLDNASPGYFLRPEHQDLLNCLERQDQGQDQSQD